MGGTNIRLSFDPFIRQFAASHPGAIIHYAELLLPVASISPAQHPENLVALKCSNGGGASSVADWIDPYTYNGFDGTYSEADGCYRMRLTQHLQKMVKNQQDPGTLILLNGRRTSPEHLVLNGSDTTLTGGKSVRLRFVYSE